jgi:hypothetical protein
MPKKAKNSLVANINKRKKAGTSRKKSESTISDEAYHNMQLNLGKSKKKGTKKKAAKKKGVKKKAAKKPQE